MGDASPRQDLGRRGEDLAAAFFLAEGFAFLDRNWRSRYGELDLVIERGGRVHFVEVKCRSSALEHPLEAITARKRERLARAVDGWLQAHPGYADREYQVDAYAIWREAGTGVRTAWVEGI